MGKKKRTTTMSVIKFTKESVDKMQHSKPKKGCISWLESKEFERTNPVFKAKESVYQLESNQSSRKDPGFKTKEKRIKAICKNKSCIRPQKENQSNKWEQIMF